MPSIAAYDKRSAPGNLGGLSEYVAGLPTNSATNGITATPAGTQANSVPIVSVINRITVVATIGDSVTLPQAVPGMQIVIANAGAASANVFPFLGDAVNAQAANAAYALAATKTVEFYSANAGVWHTILSA